jgi:uncharacterized membrane protein
MATVMETPAAGVRRRGPLDADRFERLLSVAAGLLLAAVLIALAKGRHEWSAVPLPVWLHLATIAAALALTPVILIGQRGTALHRRLGRVWAVAMLATAIISFDIRLIARGGFSWIHLLSVWTLIQVPILWWTARRHQVARHRRAVRGMIIGALLIAGFFTFPFDRLLGHWLFG